MAAGHGNAYQRALTLHRKQMEVFRERHRFKVVVAGRRSGKTFLARAIIIRAAAKPKQKIWYVAPTYQMARQIMWDELLEALPRKWIQKINMSIFSIRLINGTLIELKGADKPDTLRGVGLNLVVLDEAQDMKPDVWKKVIRPTLASTRGFALILGTPKGFNLLYELYTKGQKQQLIDAGLWRSWTFMTADSPFVPASEIDQARQDLDPKSFRQEYEAGFESATGRVYYPFDRTKHVGNYPFNPHLPIWAGQDFNVDPMSCVIMQPQPGGELWIVDEIILPNSSTEEVCAQLDRKFWRWQESITVYPDPACTQRSSQRGESDLDVLRQRGFTKLKYRRKHPAVVDRINAVNSRLQSADGRVRLRVNESCRTTISAFEQTVYRQGTRDVDKSMGVEHPCDAVGYCIELEFPMRVVRTVGVSI